MGCGCLWTCCWLGSAPTLPIDFRFLFTRGCLDSCLDPVPSVFRPIGQVVVDRLFRIRGKGRFPVLNFFKNIAVKRGVQTQIGVSLSSTGRAARTRSSLGFAFRSDLRLGFTDPGIGQGQNVPGKNRRLRRLEIWVRNRRNGLKFICRHAGLRRDEKPTP